MQTSGYGKFGAAASQDGLRRLSELVAAAQEAQRRVLAAEDELKRAQSHERDIVERQIPDLMDELGGIEAIEVGGRRISVSTTLRASVPEQNREAAYSWLATNGHGAVIKRTLSVEFGVGEEARALEFRKALADGGYEFRETDKVEPSTLRALIAELLERGDEVPLELFGAWRQRRAKVK